MIVEREREMRPTIREQEEDEARLRREEQEEEWKGREEGKGVSRSCLTITASGSSVRRRLPSLLSC
jgi:hypothetical protein